MSKQKPDWISQADWDSVDSPELTEADFARMRPMSEEHKELFRRARGPQKAPTKQLVSLRLDRDVIDHFRAEGDGWQSRMNAALRKAAKL